MAGGIRVHVSGFRELDAQLKKLSQSVARDALQRAGRDAMEPMARLARQLVPTDTHELQESIEVGAVAEDDFAAVGGREYSAVLKGGGSKADAVGALRDARRAVKGQRGNYYADMFMGPVAQKFRGGETPEEKKQNVLKGFYQEFGDAKGNGRAYLRPAFDQDKAAMLERLKKEIWFEVLSAIERSDARAARRAAKG